MNLNKDINNNLCEFLLNNCLINKVEKITKNVYSKSDTGSLINSQSLIDVIIENGDYIQNTDVIQCPFSDHCFVTANIIISKSTDSCLKTIETRSLNAEKISQICHEIEKIDFKRARNFILQQLKSIIPDSCCYHSLSHSLDVEKAVIRLSNCEGLSIHEKLLLRTAALLHDIGFAVQYDSNEKLALQFADLHLPDFGYEKGDINKIKNCILATERHNIPKDKMAQILCDADLDYLGREDYHELVNKLRQELKNYGQVFSDKEWISFQLNFFENKHRYFTQSAFQIRGYYKQQRILELKKKLRLINEN